MQTVVDIQKKLKGILLKKYMHVAGKTLKHVTTYMLIYPFLKLRR